MDFYVVGVDTFPLFVGAVVVVAAVWWLLRRRPRT